MIKRGIPYELFIGLRYLKSRGKQTFISVITVISIAGVAVGVAALIIVLAVLTGFEETLRDKILGVNSHVVLMRFGGTIKDYEEVLAKVRAVPGVQAATPFVYTQVMITTPTSSAGVVIRGVDPETAGKVVTLGKIEEGGLGALAAPAEPPRGAEGAALPGMVIGKELAANLGVILGDTVTAVTPSGAITPFGLIPQLRAFRVVGIFESGMYEYDSTLAYVGLKDAQDFTRTPNEVTGIEVRAVDFTKASLVADRIQKAVGFPFFARDWMQMNRNLMSAFRLEKIVYFIVVVLITVVAAFNIVSTLNMVVMEKTREIAILKAMGATRRGIRRIFTVEGLVVGHVGTFLGTAGGLAIALNLTRIAHLVERIFGIRIIDPKVFYIDFVPSHVIPLEVAIVVATAIAISFLATLYPSWQASGLDPAEALRYE